MRVLLALGGNAMTRADGRAWPEDQIVAAEKAMVAVVDLIEAGHDVVITHGNGPQVGDLLVKNEVAASVVPPVPLDWCGAQTQATIGVTLLNALDAELARRRIARRSAAVVTRTVVDPDDPAFTRPTKPIGRHLPEDEAKVLIEHGETWREMGSKGWRRVVASPAPREILDASAALALIEAGFVVISNGGGGVPVVRRSDGSWSGVPAVVDKDLSAQLLARLVEAEVLVVATDVPGAVLRFGEPDAEPLGDVSVGEMRQHAADGHFAEGSMGPKVDAVCAFVAATGCRGVITDLDHIVAAVAGEAGTQVHPEQ